MKLLANEARLARLLLLLLLALLGAPVLALPPDGPPGTNWGEDDRPVGSLPIVQAPGIDFAPLDPSTPGTTVVLPIPRGGTLRFLGPSGTPVGPALPVPAGAKKVRVDIPAGLDVTGILLVERNGKGRVVWTR